MIDIGVTNMLSEIRAGEQLRDKRFGQAVGIIRQYHTMTYDNGPGLDVPENHAFQYVSLVSPQMIFENPIVYIGDEFDTNPDADGLEEATNRWIKLVGLREKGIDLAIDQCFCWGVARVSQRLRKRVGDVRVNMPDLERIPQNRFAVDPLATRMSNARWMSVDIIRDKDDLLQEARDFPGRGWNVKAIEALTPGVDFKRLRPNVEETRGLDRKEITFKEVWVAEYELDDSPGPEKGFHGTILTLADTGKGGGVEIRKPRPHYGHHRGPFVVFGTHCVPEELWPLSSLYPVQTQVRDLNAHGDHVRDAAARHKRIGLGDALSAADSTRIKDAKNGDFLLVNGLDKSKVVEIEMGGITEAMMVYRNFARDLLDRSSGMTDAMRGNVTGDATATENAIADAASSVLIAFVKRQYQAAMRDVLERAACLIYSDVDSEIPLDTNGNTYHGGHGAEAEARARKRYPGIDLPDGAMSRTPTEFELLATGLHIEPASMERVDQGMQQRNAMQALTITLQAIPVMAQFPNAADYPSLFKNLGKAFNNPALGKAISPQGAQADAVAMAQVGAGGESGPVAPGGGGGPAAMPAEPAKALPKQALLRMQRRIVKSEENPQVRSKMGSARMAK